MERGSPSKTLVIDERRMLRSCLSKNLLISAEDKAKELANLKRKREEFVDEDQILAKKPDKKRVSFGDVSYIDNLEDRFKTDELISVGAEGYYEVCQNDSHLEEDIGVLEPDSVTRDREAFDSASKSYNSSLDTLSSNLGVNPKAPTAEEINALKCKNEALYRQLEELQFKIRFEEEEKQDRICPEKAEVKQLQKRPHTSQLEMENSSKNSKSELQILTKQLQLYAAMARIEMSRISDTKFRCKATKSESEHLVFELMVEVKEKSNQEVLHYSMIRSTLLELDGFLASSVRDIQASEIPALFQRLLKIVGK